MTDLDIVFVIFVHTKSCYLIKFTNLLVKFNSLLVY